jgi:hypothetical protein
LFAADLYLIVRFIKRDVNEKITSIKKEKEVDQLWT